MYKHVKFNGKTRWDNDLRKIRDYFYEPEHAKYIIPPPPQKKKKKKATPQQKRKTFFRTQVVNWLNNGCPLYKKRFMKFMNDFYKIDGSFNKDIEPDLILLEKAHFENICNWIHRLPKKVRATYLNYLNNPKEKKHQPLKDKRLLSHPLNRIYYNESPKQPPKKNVIIRKSKENKRNE